MESRSFDAAVTSPAAASSTGATRRKGVFTLSGGLDAGRVLTLPREDVISLGRASECTYPFDDVHELYGTVPMRVFECLLLYAILFHTFNGLRLVLLDVAELRAHTARRLLQGAVVLSALVGTTAAVLILEPVVA